MERDASSDRSVGRAPGQGLSEEGNRFLELGRRLSEAGERRRQVMEGPSAPAVVCVLGEVRERHFEGLARAGQVGRGAGGPEEDGDIVNEAGSRLFRREGESGQHLPELVGERAGRSGVAAVGEVFLRSEPVPIRRYGIGPERVAKMLEETLQTFSRC